MIAGVLLAAGASTRMGRDKALVRSGKSSFLVHGVRRLWAACDTVIVVLGANAPMIRKRTEEEFGALVESGAMQAEFQQAHRKGGGELEVHFVVNTKWKRGMLTSVRAGLIEALELDPAGVLVLPVDHPEVKPITVAGLTQVMLQAVVACRPKERAAFSYAVVPRYRRRRGHPLALTPALARAIVADADAEDLSDAVRRNARLVGYLDVADAGIVRNRNTPKS